MMDHGLNGGVITTLYQPVSKVLSVVPSGLKMLGLLDKVIIRTLGKENQLLPQHFLYFLPLLQKHGSFLPIFLMTGLLVSGRCDMYSAGERPIIIKSRILNKLRSRQNGKGLIQLKGQLQ